MYSKYVKRMLDFSVSLAALIALSPVILTTALLVRLNLGRPVIYKPQRPGKNEKIFTLYKFRSMTDEKDEEGKLLPDEKRLTKFGSVLRSTSLDELPELINILKGDMSWVGPRPLEVYHLPYYTERERHRHDVLPGLTGLAQVSGRNNLTWEQRFEYDLEYVDNVSFMTDAKIFFRTIAKTISREGISTPVEIEDLSIVRGKDRERGGVYENHKA